MRQDHAKGMKGIVDGEVRCRENRRRRAARHRVTGAARNVKPDGGLGERVVIGAKVRAEKAAELPEEPLREEIEADETMARISKRLLQQAPTAPPT